MRALVPKATFVPKLTYATFEIRAETSKLRFLAIKIPSLTLNSGDTWALLSVLPHFLKVVWAYEIIVSESACVPAVAAVREVEQVAWRRIL